MPATWKKYREDLEHIVKAHPALFPDANESHDYDFIAQPSQIRKVCRSLALRLEQVEEGLEGLVVGHPLGDWDNLGPLFPTVPSDDDAFWLDVKRRFEREKREGNLAHGGMEHGFMYMRLFYLRGFEYFMLDVAMKDPRLDTVIDMVLGYNLAMVKKQLELGAELMDFGDDLGTQRSLPISPSDLRR